MTDWNKAVHEVTNRRHKRTLGEKDKEVKRLLELVEEQELQVQVALALAESPAHIMPIPKIKSGASGSAIAFAIASDWHVEETVDPRNVNDLNAYDMVIAQQRVRSFFAKVIRLTEIQRSGTKIDTLVLGLLGDLMTGYIHEELRETNGLSPTETVLWLQDEIASGLALLEQNFSQIIIPCCIGNHGRCHDDETELLSRAGWKRYDEIKVGDTVATYNMETGETEWQRLTDVYVAEYEGKMFHVKTATTDYKVTPHHRMVVKTSTGKDKFEELQTIVDKGTFGSLSWPKCALGQNREPVVINDDLLRLIGWVMTDGSYGQQRGVPVVRIHQGKQEGIDKIQEILDRLGICYREFARDRDTAHVCGRPLLSRLTERSFSLSTAASKWFTELLPDKYSLPDWFHDLSTRQFSIFISAVLDGDGHVRDKESVIYGRESFLSQLQALAVTNGVAARLRKDNRGQTILSLPNSKRGYINKFDEQVREVHYSGIIWCGTVENGTLITRRNGIPLVSGNTTIKPRHATGAKNSYEWLLYQVMRKQFPQFQWQIADGYHNYLEVDGRIIRFHHGDDLKYQGGVGGLTIPVEKAIAKWNMAIRADLDIFGHWHQSQQNPKWISNASLIGHNAYAISIKAGFEPPSQTFFLMDSKRGRTVTCPIYLD